MDFILGALCTVCVIAIVGTAKVKVFNRIKAVEKDISDLNELVSEIAGGEF